MPKRKASNSSVTKEFSNSLNDRNDKSAEESGVKKLKKHVLQGPSDGVDDSRDQSKDLEEESGKEIEEDPEEGSSVEMEEDPEEESGEELEKDPEEESGEEVEEDREEESGEEVEEDPEDESCEELEKDPDEESGKELEEDPAEEVEEDPEEESGEEVEEEPEEESREELEKDPDEESGEEVEEDPDEESGEEVEEDPDGESGEEVEEEPDKESGEEVEEEPDKESGEEVEEEPDKESGEEVEEEPDKESGEEVEEEPDKESGEEVEEESEKEWGEEVEEESEKEWGEELEEDPEEESGEEVDEEIEEESEQLEEDPEEKSSEELEEDSQEESGEERQEDLEEESGEELEEDPEEDPEIDKKQGNESGNEVPLFSQASLYQLQNRYKQEGMQSQELASVPLFPELSTNDTVIFEATTDKSGSKKERPGNSGKQSRWEPQPDGGKLKEDDQTCKRKTRWSGEETQMKMLDPLQQPDFKENFAIGSDRDPQIELKSELLEINRKYKSGSKKERAGNSGKQRHSRWEPQPDKDELKEDDQTCKRRSTRWSSEETQMKMLGPLQLPHFTENFSFGSDRDPQIWGLKSELLKINIKLQSPIIDDRPDWERSPSPNPIYDNLGIRLNTREARFRQRLTQKRQKIISKLIKLDPTFNPPPDYKPQKLVKRLYIPVKEYPEYNFIGLIIGPRGNTLKRMEKETGAKILLRGKGSLKTSSKSDSEEDDLHVRIEANIQESLDAAVTMVEKLLVPIEEGRNEHKRAQLRELAELKATKRDENVCSICGDQGHRHYACPNLQSTFKMDSFGTCSNTISTPTIPVTALFTHNSSLPVSGLSLSSKQNRQTKPEKEISDKNLYVGYLPQSIDDNRLSELFSPFGKITEANVVKDRSTGTSKGYGFVKFEDSKNAALAIAHLNGFKTDGKILKVKIAGLQPNNETPRLNPIPQPNNEIPLLNPIPQIPGRSALSTNVTNRTDQPGPLHFMLPEHQSSFDDSSCTNMFSCTVNSDHDDPMKAKSLAFTHWGNTLISPHFGYSGKTQSGNFADQSLFSSNNSTAQFPGDPSKLGNFNPFYDTNI